MGPGGRVLATGEETMKWEMGDLGDGYRQMRVEAPWEEIAPDYHDILEDFRGVAVPGFRPGKAPRQVLEVRFKREIVDHLSRRGAGRLCRLALAEAGVQAAGPVEVSEVEWERGQTFRFTARFFPLPEFDLPDYRSWGAGILEADDPPGELSLRLLERVDFSVPVDLVQGELAFEGQADGEPGSEAWQAAARRVKLMLILKRLAREEGIEVEDADVEQRIQEKAGEFGTEPEALKTDLEKGGGRARLKDLLLAESVLAFLLEIMTGQAE
jgi:FKBP-type peptidyl-prolyl cis-trans isomerase (trigger factor)